MNFAETLATVPSDIKRTFNKIQKLNRKLSKAKNAVLFNDICIQENILPKYTNIKLHDQRAKKQLFTEEFQRNLVKHQLKTKQELVEKLDHKLASLNEALQNSLIEASKKKTLFGYLDEKAQNYEHADKIKVKKKLTKLYGGQLNIPEGSKRAYINLSSVELTEAQHKLLNLGLNCHFQKKRNIVDKQTELELLYQNILRLEGDDKVSVHPDLKGQLAGEGSKIRGDDRSKLLTRDLREAAKQLRDDERIVIRRADKTSCFVILNRDDYNEKLNRILSDETKFTKLTEDPTKRHKAEVNRIIARANALIGGVHFETISGEYTPGYAYGTVKTHKPDNPLRPIISQVCTSTYKLAKRLNGLLKPYIPSKYSINSSDEFLDLLRAKRPEGEIASIDVESLFTNVPVDDTIEIIIDEVYHKRSNGLDKLALSPSILKDLLIACTKDSPFRGPEGKLYTQKDGVAMGSPLGPLFASFYMAYVENKTFSKREISPKTYCRYVDDVFLEVRDENHLLAIIAELEKNSVLRFTYEKHRDNCLAFLDVIVKATPDRYITSVYVKPTNTGQTLNAKSECPSKYKQSVLRAFVARAIKTSSTHELMHTELNRVKQLLVNNGYCNSEIDQEINKQLERQRQSKVTESKNGKSHILYYRNYMNTQYKTDEKILKDIIKKNVKCNSDSEHIELRIYYQGQKTSQLVMKNNPNVTKPSNRTNVIYKFSCSHEDCRSRDAYYLGATTTTLTRRLTMHLREETGPVEHWITKHKQKPSHKTLKENTKTFDIINDHYRLFIQEALYIARYKPPLNTQKNTHISLALWGV